MFRLVKNAVLKGLVIMIPVVVVLLTIRELFEIMIQFATPIADLFPRGTFTEEDATEVVAVILILLAAFLLGLLWTIKPTRAAFQWLEQQTLHRLPMYRMLKSLVAAFLDIESENAFKPAVLRHADGSLEPVYVIEPYGSDRVVIMQPWTPTPFAGSVKIVPAERVEPVAVTLDEYSLALTHFGMGLATTLEKGRQSGGSA